MAIALTLGAAGLVIPLVQVAHALKVGQQGPSLAKFGIITGMLTSPLPPGFILQKQLGYIKKVVTTSDNIRSR